MNKTDRKYFEDILNSDDEYPDDILETPELPAYMNDSRFEPINFNWVSKVNGQDGTKLMSLYSELNAVSVYNKTNNLKPGEKLLLRKGVLNNKDILCLKHVEKLTSDEILLWFVNFLVYKEMQSNYKFLKSCLVSQDNAMVFKKIESFNQDNGMKKLNYEISTNV